MKKFFLFVLFFSTSVTACPDFTGKYKNCRNLFERNGKAFDVRVTQKKLGKDYEFSWQVVKGEPKTYPAHCTKDKMLASSTIGSTYVIGFEGRSFVLKHYSTDNKKNPVVTKCDLP